MIYSHSLRMVQNRYKIVYTITRLSCPEILLCVWGGCVGAFGCMCGCVWVCVYGCVWVWKIPEIKKNHRCLC